tara:strand:- start:156 stop:347 length:192 start_codon:yes stop_codon:yes gene_type:complete
VQARKKGTRIGIEATYLNAGSEFGKRLFELVFSIGSKYANKPQDKSAKREKLHLNIRHKRSEC